MDPYQAEEGEEGVQNLEEEGAEGVVPYQEEGVEAVVPFPEEGVEEGVPYQEEGAEVEVPYREAEVAVAEGEEVEVGENIVFPVQVEEDYLVASSGRRCTRGSLQSRAVKMV